MSSKKQQKGTSRPDSKDGGILFKVSEIHDTEVVEIKPMRKRASKYQPVIDRIKELKAGKSVTIQNLPSPQTGQKARPKDLHNRLNAAITRSGAQPPAGCRFKKVTTVNDDVVISCVRDKPAHKK